MGPPGPTHTNQIVNRWRHNLDFYKVASSVPVVKLLRTGGRGLPRDEECQIQHQKASRSRNKGRTFPWDTEKPNVSIRRSLSLSLS